MSYTTQCPACQTRFKVSDAHLALADGMVRCGRCSHVFHAPSHFDQPTPPVLTPPVVNTAATASTSQNSFGSNADDDFELELPDFQPEASPAAYAAPAGRKPPVQPEQPLDMPLDMPDFELMAPPEEPISWDALDEAVTTPKAASTIAATEPQPEEQQQDIAAFQRALAEALQPAPRSQAPETTMLLDDDRPAYEVPPTTSRQQRLAAQYEAEDEEQRTELKEPTFSTPLPEPDIPPFMPRHDAPSDDEHDEAPRRNWLGGVAMGLFAVVGILLLLLQLAFINRTTVSAELPELRPAFETLCRSLGCEVPLPTQRQLIRTEWSELSFVPQNEHLIQLNATLKNLAPYPQAFPLMELSLKDGEDRVLIRKTLKPEQYLSPEDLKLGRFNANSELKILTRMEVQQAKALGYSLHFYYP